MDDDQPPQDDVIYGRPLGLHAVRDEPASLGAVLRNLLEPEAQRAGPATRAWLDNIVARADV